MPRIAAFAAWQTYYVRAQVRRVRYSVNYRYRRAKIPRGRVRPRAIYAWRFIRCRYVRNAIVVARLSRDEIDGKTNETDRGENDR